MSVDEKKQQAAQVSQTRLLTQEEFQKINKYQFSKLVEHSSTSKKHKRANSLPEPRQERGELAGLGDIERIHKRRKHDKESRLETVLAGREGREKFGGGPKKKMNPQASTTNKQKTKNKPFMMVKQKLRQKGKKSFREKQRSLRDSLLKRKKGK